MDAINKRSKGWDFSPPSGNTKGRNGSRDTQAWHESLRLRTLPSEQCREEASANSAPSKSRKSRNSTRRVYIRLNMELSLATRRRISMTQAFSVSGSSQSWAARQSLTAECLHTWTPGLLSGMKSLTKATFYLPSKEFTLGWDKSQRSILIT